MNILVDLELSHGATNRMLCVKIENRHKRITTQPDNDWKPTKEMLIYALRRALEEASCT